MGLGDAKESAEFPGKSDPFRPKEKKKREVNPKRALGCTLQTVETQIRYSL